MSPIPQEGTCSENGALFYQKMDFPRKSWLLDMIYGIVTLLLISYDER
jgi:hypothetical protein